MSWDTGRFQHLNHIITRHWILFKGFTNNSDQTFICINVYGPQETIEKFLVWEQLGATLTANTDIPTCIMGDFNSIREKADRVNYIHSDLDAEVFNDFINNNGLINIKTQSPHYT